jgi:hypothetical protein
MTSAKLRVYTQSKSTKWQGTLTANGNDLGLITLGEDTSFDIPTGDLVLKVKAEKSRSNKLTLSGVRDSEEIEIICDINESVFSNAASISTGQAGCMASIIILIMSAIADTLMPRTVKLSRKS